jgi:hypothetical protein
MPYDVGATMPSTRRIASSLLLAGGIVLVFAGMNSPLGFSIAGMAASLAAIAALLYAGATWFGAPPRATADRVLVFDHTLRLTAGGSLLARFPEAQRDAIRAKATATLAGARPSVIVDGRTLLMVPIISDSGMILYGAVVDTTPQAMA